MTKIRLKKDGSIHDLWNVSDNFYGYGESQFVRRDEAEMLPNDIPDLVVEFAKFDCPVFPLSRMTPEIEAYLSKYGMPSGVGYGVDFSA